MEDEALVALEMEEHLRAAGHNVLATADTAGDAISTIIDSKPDLVLLDIQLAEGTSGLDVAAEIKGCGPTVVFATGNCPGLRRDDALACLHKPFSGSQLLRAIEAAHAMRLGHAPADFPSELHFYR